MLFAGEIQSIAGDQLGRVALSVLVFDRTGSAAATAATYAATLLPAILGGFFGARLADRLPRRTVMIVVEALRALCFAVMAVPAVPLGAVIGLLVGAVALGPVFSAAQLGYLASELEPEYFRTGTAARMMTSQSAQVLGFLLGGAVVAAIGARATLAVDAATFALSALAVATLMVMQRGGRQAPEHADSVSAVAKPAEGHAAAGPLFAGLLRTPGVRTLVLLGCIVGFFVVPEGLAVPYARSADAGNTAVGVLLAAGALGGALGAVLMTRFSEGAARRRAAYRMAMLCGLPLVLPAVIGGWPFAALCWLVSGALAAYMVEVTAALVQLFPAARRSHYIGVVGALLLASQGAGLLVFGAVAGAVAPATAIAIAGVVGSILATIVRTESGDDLVRHRRRRRASRLGQSLAQGGCGATGDRAPQGPNDYAARN